MSNFANVKKQQKIIADIRRRIGREFGFRQNSYINFRSESGYFFCIYFLSATVRLTVKPMYADDLWWDIWDAQDNKEQPISLRGTGAFSLPGQILATYNLPEDSPEKELREALQQIFQNASREIAQFLSANPDPDKFFPDETKMDCDPDRMLYLMALIRNGREGEVLDIISEARQHKHKCMFRSGNKKDSYTYIANWCTKDTKSGKIHRRLLVWEPRFTKNENTRKGYKGRTIEHRYKEPWLVRTAMYWLPWALMCILGGITYYFWKIYKITLYDNSWVIWLFSGTLLFVLIAPLSLLKKKKKWKDLGKQIVKYALIGFCLTPFSSFLAIGLFNSVNYCFAEKELTFVTAIVTNDKDIHTYGYRHRYLNRYITKVEIPSENRALKIDNIWLIDVPAQSEVTLIYRRGFLGVDIFEDFAYPRLGARYDELLGR